MHLPFKKDRAIYNVGSRVKTKKHANKKTSSKRAVTVGETFIVAY